MIETLNGTSRAEVVNVFSAAFSGHPLLPPDPTGRRSRLLAKSILAAFAAAPDAHVFAIRRHGRLDSAAFVFDASHEPQGFTLILLLIRMVRVLGWRMSRKFGHVLSEKPVDVQRRLELMLLGTREDCQGQGLGRTMMRHIFEFAGGQGYQSVVLEVPKKTPAFGFYLREGFLVEKEIALPIMPLCLLRRPLTEHAAEPAP